MFRAKRSKYNFYSSNIYSELKSYLDAYQCDGVYLLKRFRAVTGFSQSEVAELLQLDRKTISRIECGQYNINVRLIYALNFINSLYEYIIERNQIMMSNERKRMSYKFKNKKHDLRSDTGIE
ncbi:MAG: helix-turn-helix transcriptional regulator [Sphingobacterium sp.]